MDISEALAADSDEMVAADLIGSPPRVFTITDVDQVAREGKRVARVRLAEFPRPWLASKGMARVMADNWGVETQNWIGRQVELYGDPDVYFGKEKTGGVRISRLSHIDKPKTTRINPRSGKNSSWTVNPLPDAPTPPTESAIACATDKGELGGWWREFPALRGVIEARVAELDAEPAGGES